MRKNIIFNQATILDALMHLDNCFDAHYTLFVINKDDFSLQGTLTDGDIRRYLIKGGNLVDCVKNAMNVHYKAIYSSAPSQITHLHKLRELGIRLIPMLDENNCIIDIIDLQKYKSILPVDAVLIAGGKGERLRPITEKIPKPLVPLGAKPIIEYNVERLISYGVKNISVTVNYLKEQIESYFAEPKQGIQIKCIREPNFLGTLGSIKYVKNFYNDIILVMNSDLFTNIDYEDFYLHFIEHNAVMSVASVPYSISVPFGVFELEGRNIKSVNEKPVYNYYINAGIYLLKKSVLDMIPKGEFFNSTDLIHILIANKQKVIRFPITGYWIDIGQHADLKKAEEFVKHMK